MSGNNGDNGSGSPSFDCNSVSIKTTIASPDPAVLGTLKPRDILNVNLRTATGPLIAVTIGGDTLGSIFTTDPTSLIDCINRGYTYQAEILSISGGNCNILITTR